MATGLLNRLHFRDGDIPVSKLKNRGFETNLAPLTYGNIWYVDTGHAASANKPATGWGKDPNHPFDTIAYAITQSLILQGDVILVNEGHTESVSAADAWLWEKAGVYVLGLGWGNTRPLITFDTVVGATILMDKASLVIDNFRFINAIDALLNMVTVSAAACVIRNCEFTMDAGTTDAIEGVLLTTGADKSIIDNCDFEALTAGADFAISVDATLNRVTVSNCSMYGHFVKAGFFCDAAAINLLVSDCRIQNTNTTHDLEISAAALGMLVRNHYGSTATLHASVDPGSMKSFECFHCGAVDKSGALSPAIDA